LKRPWTLDPDSANYAIGPAGTIGERSTLLVLPQALNGVRQDDQRGHPGRLWASSYRKAGRLGGV
jgi:hypothetical protein